MGNEILDQNKARLINPLDAEDYNPPVYIIPGTEVSVKIESRNQELAILAAFDYGLGALGNEGKRQIEMLIADLKMAITGR